MSVRDYEQEQQTLTAQLAQLDASIKEQMQLDESLSEDIEKLTKELRQPATALDPKRFAKVNAAVESATLKRASANRGITAITAAKESLTQQRARVMSDKHTCAAKEFAASAVAVADTLDSGILPELTESVARLLTYLGQTFSTLAQANIRFTRYDPKAHVAETLARALREQGLDIRAGSGGTGHVSVSEALAEFEADIAGLPS